MATKKFESGKADKEFFKRVGKEGSKKEEAKDKKQFKPFAKKSAPMKKKC